MTSPRALKVAVLGGGVLGASTAAQLARGGADVVLITEGPPASGASGRSLSWLNSAGRHSEQYHRLRMAGIDRYRTLAARHPGADWLRFDGGVTWFGPDDAEKLHATVARQRAVGYDSVLVTPQQVRRRFPALDADRVPEAGALWNPGEGWVDLPSLVDLCLRELQEAGAELLTGTGRASVEVSGGRVAAVRTARGDVLSVDAALLATGADVPRAAAELGVTIPDATPPAFLVRTEPVATELRQVLNTPRVALRPGVGGTLSVDSDWTVPAITQADGRYRVPDAVVRELLAEASAVLAGHPPLRPAMVGIGPKPIPGDGQPVLGRLGGVEGLYVAFTHSGATLALIAGELLAGQILTGEEPALLAPFGADRFG